MSQAFEGFFPIAVLFSFLLEGLTNPSICGFALGIHIRWLTLILDDAICHNIASEPGVRFLMLFEAVAPLYHVTPDVPLAGALLGMATTIKPPASQVQLTQNSDTQYRQILAGRGGLANQASAPCSTMRRWLSDVHRTMFKSRQLGRDATAMDMVLDHRLLIGLTDLPAPQTYAIRCWADVDAYWAQQEEMRGFAGQTMSQNIQLPVSAMRSTTAWPSNLDGDEDSAP